MSGTSRSWLFVQMALTLSLIAALAVAFVGVVLGVAAVAAWIALTLVGATYSPTLVLLFAVPVALSALAWLVWVERKQGASIVDRNAAGATPAEEVSQSDARLVLSEGLLSSLSRVEAKAVIAHESPT